MSPRRLPAALTNGVVDGIDGDEGGGRSYESVADAFGSSPPRAPPSGVRGWARGVLTVVVKKAVGLPAGGWSARGEPSVVVTLGKLEKRTSMSRGSDPTWNEECEFVTTFDEVRWRGRSLAFALILILTRTLTRTLIRTPTPHPHPAPSPAPSPASRCSRRVCCCRSSIVAA